MREQWQSCLIAVVVGAGRSGLTMSQFTTVVDGWQVVRAPTDLGEKRMKDVRLGDVPVAESGNRLSVRCGIQCFEDRMIAGRQTELLQHPGEATVAGVQPPLNFADGGAQREFGQVTTE